MIQIRVHQESDLYNPYDPDQFRINEKLYLYLKSFCSEAQFEQHIHDTMQLITDCPIDGDKFKAAILDAVRIDREEFDKLLSINNRRAIWCYIVGLMLSVVGVAISLLADQVLLAIISFFGTLTISDGLAIHTKINPDIRRMRRRLAPLSDFELEVIPADPSSPNPPAG